MNDYYEGIEIKVKPIKKRTGGVHFGLFRPMSKSMCLDIFEDLAYANLVAKYIEEHGGSYEAKNRKAAKQYADNILANRLQDSRKCL